MGETSPPTAADYARHDASVARQAASDNETKIATLARLVRDLNDRLLRVEQFLASITVQVRQPEPELAGLQIPAEVADPPDDGGADGHG